MKKIKSLAKSIKLIFMVLLVLVIYGCSNSNIFEKNEDIEILQTLTQNLHGMSGEFQTNDFDSTEYLTTWNFNNLPENERSKFYRETLRTDGSLFREYWLYAEDKEIEVAPGIFYPAWTYNGKVPGPTIRATEGDRIKINFLNLGTKPHTIHTHGIHKAEMDGAMNNQLVLPGESFAYEFDAEPFGTHVYHCHSFPVSEHISRGLYGAYIIDPKNDTRPKPDKELVMVMNGFDVNFDGENEIYAVNTRAFTYSKNPIKVKKGELIRIHLSNMLEFDMINSFHIHATFFDQYPTGTRLEPDFYTDTIIMGQGERSILDLRFKFPGKYMFHPHKTEFAELGWMGFFEVEE